MENTKNPNELKTTPQSGSEKPSRTTLYALGVGGLLLAFFSGMLVSELLPEKPGTDAKIERALSEAKARQMMKNTTDSFRAWRGN